MKGDYIFLDVLDENLVGLRNIHCGDQLWARLSRTPTKYHECDICRKPIEKPFKVRLPFRPVGNANNRGRRICSPCMNELVLRRKPTTAHEERTR